MLGAANCATFVSNASDFQRYAQRPKDTILGNLLGFPIANLLIAIVGNIVGAASQVIFGELGWNPIEFLDKLQTANYRPVNRAGCFFVSLMFAYCAISPPYLKTQFWLATTLRHCFPSILRLDKASSYAQWYPLPSILGSYSVVPLSSSPS